MTTKKPFDIDDVEGRERRYALSEAMSRVLPFSKVCAPEGIRSISETEEIERQEHRVPKTLIDQVSPSPQGRTMQVYAEEVRHNVDEATNSRFEFVQEAPEMQRLVRLFNSGKIQLKDPGTGVAEFTFAPDLDSQSLKGIKEALLDLKLDPERRTEMLTAVNALVAKVDQAVEEAELKETPDKIVSLLRELGSLYGDVRKAIQSKQYSWLPAINELLIRKAAELHDAFNRLRASDPDQLVEIVQQMEGNDAKLYKTALINFVKTHNSFSFSTEVEDGLAFQATRHQRYNNRRDTFVQALFHAYKQKKASDDPYTFLQETTRIPANRFKQIVERAMA